MNLYCTGARFPNCSDHKLEPEPDIAGIGVWISFLVPASFVPVIAFFACLVLPLDYRQTTVLDKKIWEICDSVLSKICPPLRDRIVSLYKELAHERGDAWRKVLCDTTLSLSDTQLLTGVALTLASTLKCDLSMYHLRFLGLMIWMAVCSYSTGLAIVRHVLLQYPLMGWVRLAGLTVLCGICFYIIILGTCDMPSNSRAYCANLSDFSSLPGEFAFLFFIDVFFIVTTWLSTVILLIPGWLERADSLQMKFFRRTRRAIMLIISSLFQMPTKVSDIFPFGSNYLFWSAAVVDVLILLPISMIPLSILTTITLIILVFMEILCSFWVSSLLSFIFLALSIVQLKAMRISAREEMEDSEENEWGFGQTLAVSLLLSTLVMVVDTMHKSHMNKKIKTDLETLPLYSQLPWAGYDKIRETIELPTRLPAHERIQRSSSVPPVMHSSAFSEISPRPFSLLSSRPGSSTVLSPSPYPLRSKESLLHTAENAEVNDPTRASLSDPQLVEPLFTLESEISSATGREGSSPVRTSRRTTFGIRIVPDREV